MNDSPRVAVGGHSIDLDDLARAAMRSGRAPVEVTADGITGPYVGPESEADRENRFLRDALSSDGPAMLDTDNYAAPGGTQ